MSAAVRIYFLYYIAGNIYNTAPQWENLELNQGPAMKSSMFNLNLDVSFVSWFEPRYLRCGWHRGSGSLIGPAARWWVSVE